MTRLLAILKKLFHKHTYSIVKRRINGWQVEYFGFKEFVIEDRVCVKCGKTKHVIVERIK